MGLVIDRCRVIRINERKGKSTSKRKIKWRRKEKVASAFRPVHPLIKIWNKLSFLQ